MELDSNFITIKNFYENIESKLMLGDGKIILKNIYYKENVVRIIISEEFCINFEKIWNQL